MKKLPKDDFEDLFGAVVGSVRYVADALRMASSLVNAKGMSQIR